MSAWGDFSVPGGQEIAGLWFARGVSTQADAMLPLTKIFSLT